MFGFVPKLLVFPGGSEFIGPSSGGQQINLFDINFIYSPYVGANIVQTGGKYGGSVVFSATGNTISFYNATQYIYLNSVNTTYEYLVIG